MPAFAEPPRGTAHLAYGETIAPPKVDTLRDENCPICGEDDAFLGTRCSVCGYVAPPSPFSDPDLGMASRSDLRQQQQAFDATQMADPDKLADQQDDSMLICDNCGTEFPQEPPETVDTDEPGVDVSAEETEEGEGATEGDVCPACGQGVLQSQAEVDDEMAAQGEVDPETGELLPDEDDPDAKGEAPPFGGSDKDAPEEDDDPDEDEEEQPGVAVKSSDGVPPEDDEDDDQDQDDGPVKKKPVKTKR